MAIKGMDISYWQGNVDFARVAADGIKFAILREGYAQTVDAKFRQYVEGCRKNGIEIKGVYHFSYAINAEQAAQEAAFCIKQMEQAGLGKDVIVFYDFEYDTVKKAKAKGVTLGKNECIAFTKAFCEYVESHGYKAGVYSNIDYHRNMYSDEVLSKYVYWLADYTGSPDYDCAFHQYTSSGTVSGNEFDLAYVIDKKLNKPVDRDEWYMTPQTVNAYYNPTTNEICFPAGILQPPFFDMEADDAYNYGAIGVVIGHEMTHGFDDQGRQFDKNGNLTDWWAPGDAERFEARAKVMEDFFSNIEVLPGLKGNGALTLGENLADHGGLMVSYTAFQNAMKEKPLQTEDGFTPEQRFFLAYANLWAGNIRDEEIRVRTKSDPHSLGRWRVDGALPHIDAWYEAFGITEKDSMFVPKEKRVTIW